MITRILFSTVTVVSWYVVYRVVKSYVQEDFKNPKLSELFLIHLGSGSIAVAIVTLTAGLFVTAIDFIQWLITGNT